MYINGIYSITRLNRNHLNRIYWMNRKICQGQSFSSLYLWDFAFYKLKLCLNRSKTSGSLRFGLTVFYVLSVLALWASISYREKRHRNIIIIIYYSTVTHLWCIKNQNRKFYVYVLILYTFSILRQIFKFWRIWGL